MMTYCDYSSSVNLVELSLSSALLLNYPAFGPFSVRFLVFVPENWCWYFVS
jgi:hypothetical protein